jgi:hypothetical protein
MRTAEVNVSVFKRARARCIESLKTLEAIPVQ